MMNFKNKISGLVCSALAAGFVAFGSLASCSDMLETESTRQVFDPSLSEKTDSIYYALGILQGMQELADQYVLTGEMRGDLVDVTYYTDRHLGQLADFTATTANKYDSAYVYYKIINNCNYYIAHRDTTLLTGSDSVSMNEYAAVKAIRAWTYMQLARVYGKVPFYTEPLTQVEQVYNVTDTLDMKGIVEALAPDLEQYAHRPVPMYGNTPASSAFQTSKIFIPVAVVLGDMYLETNQYAKAVQSYITYLTKVATSNNGRQSAYYSKLPQSNRLNQTTFETPSDWPRNGGSAYPTERITENGQSIDLYQDWYKIFDDYGNEIITYIPMAANYREGTSSVLPAIFGYDLYAKSRIDAIQIVPSQSYWDLSNAMDFYYKSSEGTGTTIHATSNFGDLRSQWVIYKEDDTETGNTTVWIDKYKGISSTVSSPNVCLYRNSTVLLHLAEAFNRLEMPDAAFAILKDGLSRYIADSTKVEVSSTGELTYTGGAYYVSQDTKDKLTTVYPLLSKDNEERFPLRTAFGIHSHGSGWTRDATEGTNTTYEPGLSPYQYSTVVGKKMEEMAEKYGIAVGTTKKDTINAVEDILCDEYALEFAFEGSRFFDLCRMATHKNDASDPNNYGQNFGNKWIARKLAFKGAARVTEANNDWWYLPFK